MATAEAACLYQATKLSLDPVEPGSCVDILVPTRSSSTFSSRPSPKRRRVDKSDVAYTEETFSQRHLSDDTSIYFRPCGAGSQKWGFPRCIHWRVLEERKVLELQAVDLHQDKAQKSDALLTLRLNFNHAIRPSGIAFTDMELRGGQSNLLVYILTEVGELYSITLSKDAFVKLGTLEQDSKTLPWCQSSVVNALSYQTPYRLYAKSAGQVWASLADGALVRLERNQEEQSLPWRETFFTERSWSMRGLLPWKSNSTVRYGTADLNSNAASSMVISPDAKHIWTVCLDHTLRAWNVENGKLSCTIDLGDNSLQDPRRPSEHWLDPNSNHLIDIKSLAQDENYIVLTFSPKTREFKFWKILDADFPEHGVQQIRSDFRFAPPVDDLAGVTVWSLKSFHFKHPVKTNDPWTLWIFVRSGGSQFAFTLSFKPEDKYRSLEHAWQNNWIVVHHTLSSTKDTPADPNESVVDIGSMALQGIVQKWIDHIFYPGRFSTPTLETALSIYLKGVKASKSMKSNARPLKEKICEAVGSHDSLALTTDTTVAFARYDLELATRWKTFHGVVMDLHQRREEAIGLAYDPDEGMPWLIMADMVAPIRSCSEVEILWNNKALYAHSHNLRVESPLLNALSDAQNSEIGQFLFAIDRFRASLPHAFVSSFFQAIQAELVGPKNVNDSNQINVVYDVSGFSGVVSEEDYTNLSNSLNTLGGMQELTSELFLRTSELFKYEHRGQMNDSLLSRYGTRALVNGAQDLLQFASEILLDQLLLVVFMAVELNAEELSSDFDPAAVFSDLCTSMNEFVVLAWLAENTTREKTSLERSHRSLSSTISRLEVEESRKTLFEAIFIGDWKSLPFEKRNLPELLTEWIWSWTIGGPAMWKQFDNITLLVMGYLVKRGMLSSALDFSKFVEESPWFTYLMGRLHLANADYVEASTCFLGVSHDLSSGTSFDVQQLDSAQLLDLTERASFTSERSKFFRHVADLYEQFGAMSWVADFARMALDATRHEVDETASDQTDLLSRLFTALVQTGRFSDAYQTLIKYNDLALRKRALRTLIDRLLAHKQLPLLLSFEFPKDIANEADDHLSNLSQPPDTSTNTFSFGDSSGIDQDFHKILYAFRLGQRNIRGAAMALWERLIKLKSAQNAGVRGADMDEQIIETYLALINSLSLMDVEQSWILTTPLPARKDYNKRTSSNAQPNRTDTTRKQKKQVVTLAEVRRLWQEELDRVADLEAGRYPFGSQLSPDSDGENENGMPGMYMDIDTR